MSSSVLLASLVYILPLGLLVGAALWRRDRSERRSQQLLAASKAEGLDVPPSVHPYINPNRCLGCAVCLDACPESGVLGLVRDKAVLVTAANCVGHGACREACPTDAITLVLGTREKGVEAPLLSTSFETNLPGVFVAGELGGMGLIRNAIEQGRQVIESVRERGATTAEGGVDVVIVGAGPAGFSATLAAREHGLRSRTFEQDTLGGAVAHFPRRKLVLTAPVVLPGVGPVKLRETTKEALLELWEKVERETGIRIDYHQKVKTLVGDGDGYTVTTDGESVRCRSVVLAIGRRGSPRKLDAPGEDLPKVVYQLDDPADYRGSRVLVVGAGDSALEAATSICEEAGADVTLACRGDAFPRAKPANRAKIEKCERAGRLRVIRKAGVDRVEPDAVWVKTPEGCERLGNDAILVCIGGELPFGFLREAGIETEMKHGEP